MYQYKICWESIGMSKSTCVYLIHLPSEAVEILCFFQGNRLMPVEDALENFISAYKELPLLAPAIPTLAPVALCNHCRQLRDDKHFIKVVLKGRFQVSGITVNWK